MSRAGACAVREHVQRFGVWPMGQERRHLGVCVKGKGDWGYDEWDSVCWGGLIALKEARNRGGRLGGGTCVRRHHSLLAARRLRAS